MANRLKITGIDHPGVAANDVEQLADWYCEVFGYEKWFRHRNAGPLNPVWMLKAPDGTLLEVMPKDDTARPERTTWTPGWSHLALRVANLEEAIAFLDTKNVVWGGSVINAIGGGKVRTLYDPDGNMLQILERIPG
ncbi:VOC family protein [Larkinella punicea]|uniref:VOC family protein n=1 Tax=Larkinella punicea TaxID=2315727 RepID=A0A368JSH1_9BACT|nr:VOC family protein [Larkinella punicea]RCR70610.1 VOC family protein [Larkinella punicea]